MSSPVIGSLLSLSLGFSLEEEEREEQREEEQRAGEGSLF
jgi:hypothetical protein